MTSYSILLWRIGDMASLTDPCINKYMNVLLYSSGYILRAKWRHTRRSEAFHDMTSWPASWDFLRM